MECCSFILRLHRILSQNSSKFLCSFKSSTSEAGISFFHFLFFPFPTQMSYLLYTTACLLAFEIIFLGFLLFPLPNFFLQLALSVMKLIRVPLRTIFFLLIGLTGVQIGEMWKAEEKVANLPVGGDFRKENTLMTRKFREERNFYLYAFTTCILLLEHIMRKLLELQSKQKGF